MNSKELLSREIFDKVGDTFSERTVSEKVNHFMKYGNVFLLFEVMSLRKEMKKIRGELRSIIGMLEAKTSHVSLEEPRQIDKR
jgi:hypothetical protein